MQFFCPTFRPPPKENFINGTLDGDGFGSHFVACVSSILRCFMMK